MKEKRATSAERLQIILKERNLKQSDLVQLTGISKSGISQFISGKREPNQGKLFILSKVLNVSPVWLMGFDTNDMENIKNKDDIIPIKKTRIPLLGEISCGTPIYASEEKELYVESGTDIGADFCLIARGDSMIGARIHEGDIVFVRKQEMVEHGEIAVVIINDEATLKRVYYYPDKQKIVLQAENPKYEPYMYVGEELNDIKILGKAIAFQSDVK